MVLTKVLHSNNINSCIKNVEYAVRGKIPIRAEEIAMEIVENNIYYPFKSITSCNIGNPQQLNQKPITFFRQVASLCENPDLLKQENKFLVSQLYPSDAIERAQTLLNNIGSIGAYSDSQGIPYIRNTVAKFIQERDGGPTVNPSLIYLTQGASPGVQTILSLLIENQHTGIMIPIPQYPLYSASLALYGATPVHYYLDEETDWGLDIHHLTESITHARKQGTDVKALVIINPGNPTGQCLDEKNMQEIINFCHEQHLMLLADEVYQTNVYEPETHPFISFKRALINHPIQSVRENLELVSFHSISKGMIGECGRRGGYFECVNLDDKVMEQILKLSSVAICPNVHGQIMVDLMCNPPRVGDASYHLYHEEISAIYDSLKRRSKKLETAFNRMKGISCKPAQGSMFLFPRITFPDTVIKAADKMNLEPDTYYALAMLEATGVCVVPGSGFGQKTDTWHFRSTFLPEEYLFDQFCTDIEQFHQKFLSDHSVDK